MKDDVERYGSRLGDLEKKLVGAYREATSGGPELEDEGLFEDEDEDEAGVLALLVISSFCTFLTDFSSPVATSPTLWVWITLVYGN